MEVLVIISDVNLENNVDRRDLELIYGQKYNSIDELKGESVLNGKEYEIYSLEDFTDSLNDQELDSENFFMTIVHLNK